MILRDYIKLVLQEMKIEPSERSQSLQSLRRDVLKFVSSRISKHEDSKATKDAANQITYHFAIHDIEPAQFQKDFENDSILNPALVLKNGNLLDAIAFDYRDLAVDLYAVRSEALGTPNAASGEGELMFLLLSPSISISKKRGQGDLIIAGKKVEIKGSDPRVYGNISGKDLNKKGLDLCLKYGIIANKTKKTEDAVEPWKTGNFWSDTFAKIRQAKAEKFLVDYLNNATSFSMQQAQNCFSGGLFRPGTLNQEILKSFFLNETRSWDYLLGIRDMQCSVIENNDTAINKLIDDKTIVGEPCFRMFQAAQVGMYYQFAGTDLHSIILKKYH